MEPTRTLGVFQLHCRVPLPIPPGKCVSPALRRGYFFDRAAMRIGDLYGFRWVRPRWDRLAARRSVADIQEATRQLPARVPLHRCARTPNNVASRRRQRYRKAARKCFASDSELALHPPRHHASKPKAHGYRVVERRARNPQLDRALGSTSCSCDGHLLVGVGKLIYPSGPYGLPCGARKLRSTHPGAHP